LEKRKKKEHRVKAGFGGREKVGNEKSLAVKSAWNKENSGKRDSQTKRRGTRVTEATSLFERRTQRGKSFETRFAREKSKKKKEDASRGGETIDAPSRTVLDRRIATRQAKIKKEPNLFDELKTRNRS